MTGLTLAHAWQEAHDHLERAEVVELHRALEIVKAIVGVLDRAANRAPGIVDEDIDAAVFSEDFLHDAVAVIEV